MSYYYVIQGTIYKQIIYKGIDIQIRYELEG